MFSANFFGELRRMDRLSITVPCDLRYRDAVGALIRHVCQRLEQQGAVGSLGFQVVSAFNEAFNNLVQYAYRPEPGVVDVVVELRPVELVIELQDSGRTFEFDGVESPDLLHDLPESGLGIFIMRSCMSDVTYEPGASGQKNRLRMTRRLDGDPGTDVQGTSDDA